MSFSPYLGNVIGQIANRDLRANLQDFDELKEPLLETIHQSMEQTQQNYNNNSSQQQSRDRRLQPVMLTANRNLQANFPAFPAFKDSRQYLFAASHDSLEKTQQNDNPASDPQSTEDKRLQQVGLTPQTIQALRSKLDDDKDYLYHAGRLINGKVYVISGKNKVYYGTPNDPLKSLNIVHQTTSRCIDQQVRGYIADNGLQLKVTTHNNHRSARVSTVIHGGIPLPVPQIKQASFINDTSKV